MVNGEPYSPRAPRIFLDEVDAIRADRVSVHGSQVHRLFRVLKLRRGDWLEVIHGERLLRCEVQRATPETVEAAVRETRAVTPEPSPWVMLCPSVIRPARFDLVVEKATELGVHGLQPVLATRSLAAAERKDRPARWRRLITEAAEQCRREQRPELSPPLDLVALATAPVRPGTVRVFASERESTRRITDVLDTAGDLTRVQILIGPEGGLTVSEVEAVLGNGWQPVTLGPRPLRPETAAVVASALVQEALLRRG